MIEITTRDDTLVELESNDEFDSAEKAVEYLREIFADEMTWDDETRTEARRDIKSRIEPELMSTHGYREWYAEMIFTSRDGIKWVFAILVD